MFGWQISTAAAPRKPSGAGHLFIAIDVAAMDHPGLPDSVGQLIDEVKTTPLAVDAEEIFYPGDWKTAPNTTTSPPAASSYPTKPAPDLETLGTDLGITATF